MNWSPEELERLRLIDHIGELKASAARALHRAQQLEEVASRDVNKERAAEYRLLAKEAMAEHDRLTKEAHKASKD